MGVVLHIKLSQKGRAKRKPDSIRKMGKNIMDDFNVFYDEKEDILYLAKEGEERA